MTQTYKIDIGLGKNTFPWYLLAFNSSDDSAAAVKITEQAPVSPFSRYAVEFLCLDTQPNANQYMKRAIDYLETHGNPGIVSITLWRILHNGCRLPPIGMSRQPPLALFSTPAPSCLLYVLAYADLRYHGMQDDITAWLIAEKNGQDVHPANLTEHGQWLHAKLKHIPHKFRNPSYQLGPASMVFREFANRISLENSPHRRSA
jgi:hypothetical protein